MTPETVTRVVEPGDSWWDRYRRGAAQSGLSETALRVLDLDADYVLRHGVLGAGSPDDQDHQWPEERVRRGLVVGSVQSGKTASILGVTAKGLDASIDIVVILTGTRVALWRQTFERVLEQLDRWDPQRAGARGLDRLMVPDPGFIHGSGRAPDLESLYHLQSAQVRRWLRRRRPIVAVVMKQADHLIRFGNALREAVGNALKGIERPIHLLCVDDEADDGSILDAVIEAGLEADALGLKQVPRHITRIWSDRADMTRTFHEQLFVTYLAYTATPQANFLQSDHNPLSPRDFVAALRTPLDRGAVDPPRSTTFDEPLGLPKYYTGGEVFYERLSRPDVGLCHELTLPDPVDFESSDEFDEAVGRRQVEHVGQALRAYFVAAAMRLRDTGKRISELVSLGPSRLERIAEASPKPCCMLVHPSAKTDAHVWSAELISAWSADPTLGSPDVDVCIRDAEGKPVLDAEGLATRLEKEEDAWRRWYLEYEETRREANRQFSESSLHPTGEDGWTEVKRLLVTEVFPHVRLAIINSSPAADDRPIFRPTATEGGLYRPAPDLLSIFISGNVMSRGVTIEGLTTTMFLRTSAEPLADTQMQMQRWLGYRGGHIHWCRVFLFREQLELFRAYHENDEALKSEVLAEMNRASDSLPSPMILEGLSFRATGKIANLRALPLYPGREPFVGVIGRGDHAKRNCGVLADLLDRPGWSTLTVGGTERGLMWDQQLSLVQVAEVLEKLTYDDHRPHPEGRNHKRWASLEKSLDLNAPLFRPPSGAPPGEDRVQPTACPYSIAAYLRLWSAALSRKARGLYPTDDYRTPWSLINLTKYAVEAPRFYVAIRFGGSGLSTEPRLHDHGVHSMVRDHDGSTLRSTWGSRNPSEEEGAYLGDNLFDYNNGLNGHQLPSPDPSGRVWRPRGHPGLMLFHVVRTSDGDSPTVGLCLPLGGPDHFAAVSPTLRAD